MSKQFDSVALARSVALLLEERRAEDTVVIDLRGIASYTDFLVLASGKNERQVKALHDWLVESLKEQIELRPNSSEGTTECRWVLLDYLDLVVHLFTPEAREFYRLEKLWGEAPRLKIELPEQPAVADV